MAHCSSTLFGCIRGLCSVLLRSWYVNQMFLCRCHLTVLMVWVPVFCCVQKLYSAMHRSPNLLYSVAAVFCSYWESGISQTALQEAWLNLPPHSHTQFLHQWWWWPWWQWWWQRCKLQWRYWQLMSKEGSWHLAHQLRWNGTGQYPPPPLHWNPKDSTI